MKTMVIALLAGVTAGPAMAQQAHSTPDQIVCAMSGVCGGDAAMAPDGRIAVGQEKSFSLVKPGSLAANGNAAEKPATAPATRPARTAAVSRRQSAARPNAGRMDMLVTFPLGSADLSGTSRQELKSFATAMASPNLAPMHFNIEGHTDAIGARDYNLDLSKRRADAVVAYLVSLGVSADRLTAEGFGFDKPRSGLAPRAPGNRRVEFVKAAG